MASEGRETVVRLEHRRSSLSSVVVSAGRLTAVRLVHPLQTEFAVVIVGRLTVVSVVMLFSR